MQRQGIRSIGKSLLRAIAFSAVYLALILAVIWAFGALWFDFPIPAIRHGVVVGFLCVVIGVRVFVKRHRLALSGCFAIVGLVAAWWWTLKPTNDSDWQPDVARLAWGKVNGDEVTLHNVRNFDYHHGGKFTEHWETRTVRLSQITGIDLAINYWGSPWMAHPILSFQFADAPPLCFSIETRKTVGERYSAIGGFYRRYELIYLAADERDVLRVRTNYREPPEDVYLYRTLATPARAREWFLEYVRQCNLQQNTPRWYNAITTNCTTAIRAQHPPQERAPWDWRMLLNGKADEMLFQKQRIVTGGLSFGELKRRSLIGNRARAADADADFSRRIRDGLPF